MTTSDRSTKEQARAAVVLALSDLPHADAVDYQILDSYVLDDPEDLFGEENFQIQVCAWLIQYAKVLATVRRTTAEMAVDLRTLREQRKAIRGFLGLNDSGVI